MELIGAEKVAPPSKETSVMGFALARGGMLKSTAPAKATTQGCHFANRNIEFTSSGVGDVEHGATPVAGDFGPG
jgi:hypothetical protein